MPKDFRVEIKVGGDKPNNINKNSNSLVIASLKSTVLEIGIF